MTASFSTPFCSPFSTPFSLPCQGVDLIIDATLQAYVDYVDGEGGDIGDLNAMVTTYNQLKAWGVLDKIAFLTNLDWGRSYTGLDLSGLISFVRTTAALNTAFEPLFYFSAGPSPPAKRGQIFLSGTLAAFGVGNANALVAMGYHVGFLTDSADAAHKYAVPSDSLRAALRALATPIDTVQKMIDRTATFTVANQTPKLTGTLEGLHLLVKYEDQVLLWSNELEGSIPPELGNCPISVFQTQINQMVSAVPAQIQQWANLTTLRIRDNQHTSWPDIVIPTSTANSWRDLQAHNNLMATAATGVDRIITQVGISQQDNPRSIASILNVSGASMAGPTWGTAAAPSDVAYSQRVLTYPGHWTVTVQGAVDALVADLLPDLDYKYPLTAKLSIAGTDFAAGDVKLATLDGEAMFWITGVDVSAYAVGAKEYIIALYDSTGRATFAFAEDVGAGEAQGGEINSGTLVARRLYVITATEENHFGTGLEVDDYFTSAGTETCSGDNKVKPITDVPATGLRLVSASGGAVRNVTHRHATLTPNAIVKVNIHEVV
jgi:hypothetical protein